MAKQLLWIAINAESEAVKLAAIRDALDRAVSSLPPRLYCRKARTSPTRKCSKASEAVPAPNLVETEAFTTQKQQACQQWNTRTCNRKPNQG